MEFFLSGADWIRNQPGQNCPGFHIMFLLFPEAPWAQKSAAAAGIVSAAVATAAATITIAAVAAAAIVETAVAVAGDQDNKENDPPPVIARKGSAETTVVIIVAAHKITSIKLGSSRFAVHAMLCEGIKCVQFFF